MNDIVKTVDPRVRMKEIRTEVNVYFRDNPHKFTHLGQLPENIGDARRVIIAVQDLYEIEKEKHRKATTRICALIDILDEMVEVQTDLMNASDNVQTEMEQMHKYIEYKEQEIRDTQHETQKMRHERDSVLTTMKLLNQQASIAQSVVMGHSNKDRG